MLELAALILCPLILEPPWPELLTAEVIYRHQGATGAPYVYVAEYAPVVSLGTYVVDAEGHPVAVRWSDGVFCGEMPALVFADGFESGTAAKWN
jgi:hypothetical protein